MPSCDVPAPQTANAVCSVALRAFFMAVVLTLMTVGTATVATAQESEDDGLRFQTATSFRLDPAAKAVHVAVDITLTNEVPDQGDRYYYFDEIRLGVLSEATNVSAQRVGGRSLGTQKDETEDARWSGLSIRL